MKERRGFDTNTDKLLFKEDKWSNNFYEKISASIPKISI
jgi:hypothetical protein